VSPRLAIELEKELFRPGEAIAGAVDVIRGGRSRTVTLNVHFREITPDFTHDWLTLPGGVLLQGDLADGASLPFSVRLPGRCLPGCGTASAELAWVVEVVSDEFGPNTRETITIEVQGAAGPDGLAEMLAAAGVAATGYAQAAPAGAAPAQAAPASAAPAQAAADWYPDPSGQARLRYWDGARWTEHTAP